MEREFVNDYVHLENIFFSVCIGLKQSDIRIG